MIDPVTNTQLHSNWKLMSEMPRLDNSQYSNVGFKCLVLLDTRKNPHASRIQAASYRDDIVTIGGLFSFDQLPVIAWMYNPPINSGS